MSKKKQSEQEIPQETENLQDIAAEPELPEADIEMLKSELGERTAKCEELLDKCQRIAAEYDNYRKRSVKEREQIAVDSVAQTVELLLPALDNIDRALEAIPKEADGSIRQGFEMIARQLTDAFEKIGVAQIAAVGETFDPNLHNAVMHIEDEALDASVIVEEFQKGYLYKEKVIRHSMVKVAN